MAYSTSLILLIASTLVAFILGTIRAKNLRKDAGISLVSLPRHYGYYAASWVFLPGILVFIIWVSLAGHLINNIILDLPSLINLEKSDRDLLLLKIQLLANGVDLDNIDNIALSGADSLRNLRQNSELFLVIVSALTVISGFSIAFTKIRPSLPARSEFDTLLSWILFFCAGVAVVTTLGIVFSLALESFRFFAEVPINEFLFGTHWSPQTALRDDQVGASGSFGAVPLFAGTLLVGAVALSVAAPIGLMSAIYLNQYANRRLRAIAKPLLEILAGIPTVVFGFFAAVTVAPYFVGLGADFGFTIAAESAAVAGVVIGIMIIPYISSLSDDAIASVPESLTEASLALGATRSETILKVILPASAHGIWSAMLLAISRAIGETMIVVMAVGMRPNMTTNPFEAVTTVTVQIIALLTGDQEFDQAKTLSAFALGLVLFCVTLIFNVIAQHVLRRPKHLIAD